MSIHITRSKEFARPSSFRARQDRAAAAKGFLRRCVVKKRPPVSQRSYPPRGELGAGVRLGRSSRSDDQRELQTSFTQTGCWPDAALAEQACSPGQTGRIARTSVLPNVCKSERLLGCGSRISELVERPRDILAKRCRGADAADAADGDKPGDQVTFNRRSARFIFQERERVSVMSWIARLRPTSRAKRARIPSRDRPGACRLA